ncbi:hypothetical protein O181_095597 [Austropuccinia psidii MF-1]|uniref:Uncharacterized protein n=1 Tax=Austropuccinia psidii MF-1 TaxID=1389203 RepID=A0A9Q3J538_9BASI|nr:hypothetical protein [Austropuccinia psidii MF-1]
MEEKESDETVVADAPEAPEAPNIALLNKTLVSQAEPNFLKIMEQMNKLMQKITQAVSPRNNYRAAEFKTPSVNTPHSFHGNKAHKLRELIHSYKLIFHNDPEEFFSDKKKALSSASFLTDRARK